MDRFRPRLDPLETRENPAVSPVDVQSALMVTEMARGSMQYIIDHLPEPKVSAEIEQTRALALGWTQLTRSAAATLTQYAAELQGQLAANPQLGSLWSQMTGAAGQASIYADLARWITVGFGTPASTVDPTPTANPTPAAAPPDTNGSSGSPTDDGVSDDTTNPSLPVFPTDRFADGPPAANDPRWQTLPTGEKIIDVTTGTGTAVPRNGSVTVKYIGWLASNGTKFDASTDRTPDTFQASLAPGGDPNNPNHSPVIVGWQNGIVGMQPGGYRFIYIPAANAYGNQQRGNIPPNSDLIFEVQLISSP